LAANTSIPATSAAETKSDALDTGTTQKPPQSGRGIREHKEDGRIMHEWIPVTKELPDDDRYVLVTADDVRIPFNARHVEEHGRELWLDEEDDEWDNIIAWMELPERYEEGK
jgi:hypothetical protein